MSVTLYEEIEVVMRKGLKQCFSIEHDAEVCLVRNRTGVLKRVMVN